MCQALYSSWLVQHWSPRVEPEREKESENRRGLLINGRGGRVQEGNDSSQWRVSLEVSWVGHQQGASVLCKQAEPTYMGYGNWVVQWTSAQTVLDTTRGW